MQQWFHAAVPVIRGRLNPTFGHSTGRRRWARLGWWFVTIVVAVFGPLSAAEIDGNGIPSSATFDIPAQPLSRALVAYGAITGRELYYNAALAEGRRSAAIKGTLSSTVALRMLLQGTGLVPRMTGHDAFTIVSEAPGTAKGTASEATRALYEPYFTAIQERIVAALCRGADTDMDHHEVVFQVWLAPMGVISRADVLGTGEDRALAFARTLQGVGIGTPPPLGMPQPVTLVIFPASGSSKECSADEGTRNAG